MSAVDNLAEKKTPTAVLCGPDTGIAFVGCGYVADFYAATLPNHRLNLRGVFDARQERAETFGAFHKVPVYPSIEAILADDSVEIVVNLTNPSSHYDVSRRCLEAGKHVYSEKPLALRLDHASDLLELASRRGLGLSSAPCSLLSETAQSLWHALRGGVIGQPRLAYAELDDGAIHQMPFQNWISISGAPWPYVDEFRTGPIMEHAGYYVTWLTAFFGPATAVTSYAGLLVPDRLAGVDPGPPAPDFACAVIEFASGVIARLTCGTVAPENHTFTIVGDEGVLSVDDCWNFGAPVTVRTRADSARARHHYLTGPRTYPLVRPADYPHRYTDTHDMDFARGVADLAASVRGEGRQHLTAEHAVHVLEIVLAMARSAAEPARVRIDSTFAPLAPQDWATDQFEADVVALRS
ncbi:Gfo/Idh/MocA family protein [Salinispora vitiensis]|uniref:Gfo/Idh/MocA family protein n=1 Tax=Salinispora vitiensis TaxID=999544 RepID=UPI000D6CB0CE|nr:Gfo/Idh/MocA family oxidoreductase [Salinispora vitiensis]